MMITPKVMWAGLPPKPTRMGLESCLLKTELTELRCADFADTATDYTQGAFRVANFHEVLLKMFDRKRNRAETPLSDRAGKTHRQTVCQSALSCKLVKRRFSFAVRASHFLNNHATLSALLLLLEVDSACTSSNILLSIRVTCLSYLLP